MTEAATILEDPEIRVQQVLLASSNHDVPGLRNLLRENSANVQDPETGFTPLHAAIAACEHDADESYGGGQSNGVQDSKEPEGSSESPAIKTVKLLLRNGAIWNLVDTNNETPGCSALRLGLNELYEIMVDAGVRAELLLSRLDGYQTLADSEDEADEQDQSESQDAEAGLSNAIEEAKTEANQDTSQEAEEDLRKEAEAGMDRPPDEAAEGPSNEDFLASSLRFQDGRIVDQSGNAVMMAWETGLMKRTAELLCPTNGLRILNIGHGMGIIDSFFQTKSPTAHHIIEAHPVVLDRMKQDGWTSNATIHEGRWQDVVPKLLEQGVMFDAIYFDTFAEDYKAFRDFSDNLIGLLDDGGKWSFFHGLGADRQICYDVYTKIVEMDLFESGYDVEWETIPIDGKGVEWEGVKRKYWTLKEYRLPICSFIG